MEQQIISEEIFDKNFNFNLADLQYDPTKHSLADGDDAVLDDVFSFQIYNDLKNHWRAATRPSNAQPGMICSDSDDEKLYHQTAAGENQIMQVGITVLNDLLDLNAGAPNDQDVLTWDNGTSKWIAQVAGGGAPVGAQYVVLALDGTLTAERVLTGTANQITVTDGGAGGNVTLSIPNGAQLNIDDITGTTEVTINEAGADLDFRVEGSGDADLFKTDAGNDEIFMGGFCGFDEIDNGDSGNADTIDWGTSNKQKSTLTDDCTFTFTAPASKGDVRLKLVQGGVGSFTVTWPGTVKWPGNVAPTLTTTAAHWDILGFYWDGVNYNGSILTDYQ